MEYPECTNGNCTYNEEYVCKAEGLAEDIICTLSKVVCTMQAGEPPAKQ